MGRASTLTLYERGQIKVLSTTADCLSRQALQEGYYEFPNSERLDKLNDRKKDNFADSVNEIGRNCGINASKTTVWRMLDKCPNIVRSRMKKCP
uniref:HTH_Tnp_Tc3_1 domain-containing protein n=1 Tax=Heterorhabditis bacteriophora TaxID=37862 RepID=A0A1I7WHR6_HETBA